MQTAEVGFFGAPPIVTVGPAKNYTPITEKQKYEKMWDKPQYRAVAPGEAVAQIFLAQAKPKAGAKILDLGCGTGRGSLMLAILGGMDVTMLDFASNCLDADIKPMLETQKHTMRFIEADLTKPLPASAEYGFCTDVMEHIPPEDVDTVLDHALHACQHVFFQISTVDDVCGALIGHPLHLTVKPYEWWLKKFNQRDCVVHWSRDVGNACMFYVTAWVNAQALVDVGVLNTAEETVKANVVANIWYNHERQFEEPNPKPWPEGDSQCWKQATPHETNALECMILGGGPSLNQFVDEIKQKREEGVKLITLNGSYNWALEHGLTPSAQIMVDARPFNARFSKPVVEKCVYLIASQCHPSVLEGLPREQTYLWHSDANGVKEQLNDRYEKWWHVPGGSTVLLRAIPLMRMLGYKKFHLYGCDSCIMDTKAHSYEQPENDGDHVLPVTVGGRVFQCTTWMTSQAQEFMALVKFLGDEIELEIHGDGMLKHILTVGAEMADENEFLK